MGRERSSDCPKPKWESSGPGARAEEPAEEWDAARCPVCLEHPHNAVLLKCASHDKGCRPYMCDTSYRHSNCFDQFRKLSLPSASRPGSESQAERGLLCPLCRGGVSGWVVVGPARRFMNGKARSCASETCDFAGTYMDLRTHARLEHPGLRPSEADPERRRDWTRMERRRDVDDLFAMLRSSPTEDGGGGARHFLDDGRWLTVFLMIRVFRPGSRPSGRAGSSRRRTRHWGESYGRGAAGDGGEARESGSEVGRSRVRRRLMTPEDGGE